MISYLTIGNGPGNVNFGMAIYGTHSMKSLIRMIIQPFFVNIAVIYLNIQAPTKAISQQLPLVVIGHRVKILNDTLMKLIPTFKVYSINTT